VAGIAAIPFFSSGTPSGSQVSTGTIPAPIPGNYSSYLQAANDTYDKAAQLQQQGTGADSALWAQAASYYAEALKLQPGDPTVATDFAVARFYSGDTTGAIETAEAVASANTTFTPVFLNMAFFYYGVGNQARAVELLAKVKELAPGSEWATKADALLQEMAAK
jgi:tetratricopeptide (TPR) repeat protein